MDLWRGRGNCRLPRRPGDARVLFYLPMGSESDGDCRAAHLGRILRQRHDRNFDRIRENRRLHRRQSLYKITNDAINQTLSRTVITSGLVFLSVLAMVLFGGEVLRGFSLALLIGVVFGTYSSVAIASPIMVWWEQRIAAASKTSATAANRSANRRCAGSQRRRAPAFAKWCRQSLSGSGQGLAVPHRKSCE